MSSKTKDNEDGKMDVAKFCARGTWSCFNYLMVNYQNKRQITQ